MDPLWFYLAVVILACWLAIGVELALGNRSIRFLQDVSELPRCPQPRVSVIIPARNEERNLREALASILRQDYGEFEVIAVNDRSTDRTGAILDGMAREERRLRVVHITELPSGWLGKNYALDCGARQADGDLLLFTDADVVMHPSTLRRAVGYMAAHGIDHLAVAPDVRMPGMLLRAFVVAFCIFFSLYARPWKARDPKSRRFVGIGAFNLVRAHVYRAVGTHEAIAMRPDDDIKLGKLIKKGGYRQEFLFGTGMIQVEWYASVGELIEGLTKNTFAGVEYSLLAIVGASAAQLTLNVWPFLALLLTRGETRALYAAAVLVMLVLCGDAARFLGVRRGYALGFPLATLLFVYIMWRSMLIALLTGGITWRGTRYSLAALKANKV